MKDMLEYIKYLKTFPETPNPKEIKTVGELIKRLMDLPPEARIGSRGGYDREDMASCTVEPVLGGVGGEEAYYLAPDWTIEE